MLFRSAPLTAGAVGLAAFGAAVLLVGGGMDLACSGVAKLAQQLPAISKYGGSSATALLSISGSMTACGASAVVATAGVAALAVPVAALSVSLAATDLALVGFAATMASSVLGATALNLVLGATEKATKNVSAAFGQVNDAVKKSMDDAKSNVSKALDDIKGMCANTKLSLNQSMALPHFSLSGSFNAQRGTVPTVNVQWYRKAYDNAYMLNNAAIFGSMNGSYLAGGEHGSEMVVGTDKMMSMISAAQNSGGTMQMLNRIYAMLGTYLPQANTVYLDGEKVSKSISPKITKYQNQTSKFNSKMTGIN